MKLVGLVFLGLVASVLFYILFGQASGYIIDNFFPRSEYPNLYGESSAWVFFLIVVPISFLFGSLPTGYFSYHEIETKWTLLWIAPALYISILLMSITLPQFINDEFIQVISPKPGFVHGLLFPIGMGLLWYIASAGGVFLGYYLRERFAKWWYGD